MISKSSSRRPLASRFRGLYGRIAKQLGVDASYVSRVARGERHSRRVSLALHQETQRLLATPAGGGTHRLNGFAPRYLENELIKNSGQLLKTQLHTALIMLESSLLVPDRSEKLRGMAKAQRGYDTARRLLRELRLSPADRAEIEKKLTLFEVALHEVRQNPGDTLGRRRLVRLGFVHPQAKFRLR